MTIAAAATGAAVTALGLVLFSWPMSTNAYFSPAVRIQSERGHIVSSGGAYAVVPGTW